MKTVVATTKAYDLLADTNKNRIYLTIHGFWPGVDTAANYVADWEKALKLVKPGFTVLTDVRTMVTHPAEVIQGLHIPAQKLIVEHGLLRTVEVVPANIIAEMQIDRISKVSEMPKDKYSSIEEAEAYLDQLQSMPE